MSEPRPYTARPSLYKPPGERIPPWTCACPNLKRWQRHREPPECVTQETIDAWSRQTKCSPRTARYLYWLAREFGR